MSALSSALPFPIFTCRSPSGEIFRKPKKGNCMPQSLVRKICVINFDADTGVVAQSKTHVKPEMLSFSERPFIGLMESTLWRKVAHFFKSMNVMLTFKPRE